MNGIAGKFISFIFISCYGKKKDENGYNHGKISMLNMKNGYGGELIAEN